MKKMGLCLYMTRALPSFKWLIPSLVLTTYEDKKLDEKKYVFTAPDVLELELEF